MLRGSHRSRPQDHTIPVRYRVVGHFRSAASQPTGEMQSPSYPQLSRFLRIGQSRRTGALIVLVVVISICGRPMIDPSLESGSVAAPIAASASSPAATSMAAVAASPNGGGWNSDAQGSVTQFGGSASYGSVEQRLNRPVVGMAASSTGGGYWLVASDGGVFSFGDARFYGSRAASGLNEPFVGMVPSTDGLGYWLAGQDGLIYPFGSATSVNPTTPRNSRIAFGIAMNDPTTGSLFRNYQSTTGNTPNFINYYQDPWSSAVPVISPAEPIMFSANNSLTESEGIVPVISWGTNAISLQSILSGRYDAYIDSSASQVKAYPGSVYIRLDWEMNGPWSGWNPANQSPGTTPATFVAFWRYVVTRFRSDGVTNTKWVWSPNVDAGNGSMAEFYPGADYVDMVGLDGYNKGDFPWESFGQLFQSSYNEIVNLAPGKPVMIAETSSLEANSTQSAQGLSKATWIQQMAAHIPGSMPAVTALCWYEQPVGGQDFRVESSASSLASLREYILDNPIFQGRLP